MSAETKFDVVIVGAGVFGVWIGCQLHEKGARVALVDQYGPANSRASSGGESRIFRLGYGPDEIYTRMAQRSFARWHQLSERVRQTNDGTPLFHQTGVLWLAREVDPYSSATLKTLERVGATFTKLSHDDLERAYPQFNSRGVDWGILEPESGALMARRAVQTIAAQLKTEGVTVVQDAIESPTLRGRLKEIVTTSGKRFAADQFVFACGPWLPKVFPELLSAAFHITRQEVFFFGVPSGDSSFSAPAMPIWVDFNDLVYAIPSLDNRGLKIAIDAHGPAFDPDTGDRIVSEAGLAAVREYLRHRVPALADAPVTETRVCQYENTSNGDFLIDRHPEYDNLWLVGGGSGHGFKHGPAVGEYVAGLISGESKPEPRWMLSTKERFQERKVY